MKLSKWMMGLVLMLALCLMGSAALAATTSVTNATELAAAVSNAAAGDTILLANDITISSKLTILKSIILDGDSHTLTYTGGDRAIDIPIDAGNAEVKIQDLNVVCSAGYCERGINYNATGKLTLNNVNVKGTCVNYVLNLPGKAKGCTVIINGGSYTGLTGLNVWGSNSTITANDVAFTTVDNTSAEGYGTVKLNNDGTTSAEGTTITLNGGSVKVTGSSTGGSSALSNATSTGKIIVHEAAVSGAINNPVAMVSYGNNSYTMRTLQDAITVAIRDNATAKLLKNVDENVNVNAPVELDLNGLTNKGHFYLTAQGASLKAPAGLNVYSKVVGYKAVYSNGVYSLEVGIEVIPSPASPAAPSANVPKTGDDSSLLLWAGLMLVSALGMVAAKKRLANR